MQVVKSFHREISFTTGDSIANIEVRFKGVPLGSAVEGEVALGGASAPGGSSAPSGPAGASDGPFPDGPIIGPDDPRFRINVSLDVENPACAQSDLEQLIDRALQRAKSKLMLDVIKSTIGPAGADGGGQCTSHDKVTFDKSSC